MAQTLSKELRDFMRAYVADNMRPAAVAELVERLNSEVIARVPELADHELQRDLQASTEAQLQSIMFAFTDDLARVPIPAEAHGLARSIGRRGMELRLLLHIYRVGQSAAIDYLTEVVQEQDLEPAFERTVLLWMFERTADWLSLSIETLSETYGSERERGFRDAYTRRAETIRSILDGDEVDVERASRQLDYRLTQRHWAFALWDDGDSDGGDVIAALDRLAGRIGSALGAARVLTAPSGASGLWAWAAVDGGTLDAARERHAVSAPKSVRVAFGATGSGIAGFRASHREALAAARLAQRSGGQRWLTAYRDIEVAHLASADETAMRGLIARELGAIAGTDPNSRRLRETLRAYLDNQRSPEAAARALGVHKNTVRYRLQRIGELLPDGIDARRLPLEIALNCVDVYGDEVLPGRA